MQARNQKLIVYFSEEECFVRRLGAAVISCWDALPPDIRHQLFERAIQVCDDTDGDDLEERFRLFVAEHSRRMAS